MIVNKDTIEVQPFKIAEEHWLKIEEIIGNYQYSLIEHSPNNDNGFKKSWQISLEDYEKIFEDLCKYSETCNIPCIKIPQKIINCLNEKFDDLIELDQNLEVQEMTKFNYAQLTHVRPNENILDYMERNNVVSPLWRNQISAIQNGIKRQGRVFLCDDKVCIES